jgi:hypothetical protein
MVTLLIGILFILICFCLFLNIQIGFAMVLAVDILFVRAVTLLGIPLRELFMCVTWFFFIYHGALKKEYRFPIRGLYTNTLIVFFIGIIAILFLSSNIAGIFIQLKHIFGLIYYLSYAYIAWIIYNNNIYIIKFSKILSIIVLVTTIYGIFCYITTSNPYIAILENHTGTQIIALMEENRGGLEGRIQSTMSHPLTWSGCCFLFFLFFLQKKNDINPTIRYCLLFLLIINIFLTGSRSVFVAFLFSLFLLFIYRKKNVKTILSVGLSISLILLFFYTIPSLQNYRNIIESSIFFWDESISQQSNIQGSSVSMRLLQLLGSIEMIQNNLLFGLGHGYVDYYTSNIGQHPILYGVESLIYNKLVEGGIVDLLLWLYLFIVLYRNIGKINKQLLTKQDTSIIKTYVTSYFIYSLFTGFMQTFLCFIIIYVILVKRLIVRSKIESNTYSE